MILSSCSSAVRSTAFGRHGLFRADRRPLPNDTATETRQNRLTSNLLERKMTIGCAAVPVCSMRPILIPEAAMPICETCGNDYDKAFQVTLNGKSNIFDSF